MGSVHAVDSFGLCLHLPERTVGVLDVLSSHVLGDGNQARAAQSQCGCMVMELLPSGQAAPCSAVLVKPLNGLLLGERYAASMGIPVARVIHLPWSRHVFYLNAVIGLVDAPVALYMLYRTRALHQSD